MWVPPNHPVMDDHFSIETHGELGNLGILDFGNPPLRRSVFKDLNMTLGLIQMQMQSHCNVLVGKKHSSCNCVTNTGMQPHANTCKHDKFNICQTPLKPQNSKRLFLFCSSSTPNFSSVQWISSIFFAFLCLKMEHISKFAGLYHKSMLPLYG